MQISNINCTKGYLMWPEHSSETILAAGSLVNRAMNLCFRSTIPSYCNQAKDFEGLHLYDWDILKDQDKLF